MWYQQSVIYAYHGGVLPGLLLTTTRNIHMYLHADFHVRGISSSWYVISCNPQFDQQLKWGARFPVILQRVIGVQLYSHGIFWIWSYIAMYVLYWFKLWQFTACSDMSMVVPSGHALMSYVYVSSCHKISIKYNRMNLQRSERRDSR